MGLPAEICEFIVIPRKGIDKKLPEISDEISRWRDLRLDLRDAFKTVSIEPLRQNREVVVVCTRDVAQAMVVALPETIRKVIPVPKLIF
jgi:uncharacterized sporulation protein YeaH/YhbH (DUF444 family)